MASSRNHDADVRAAASAIAAAATVDAATVRAHCPWVDALPDGDVDDLVDDLARAHPDPSTIARELSEWAETAAIWRDNPELARELAGVNDVD